MIILVLNAGSSSYKGCLFEMEKAPREEWIAPLWEAEALRKTPGVSSGSLELKAKNSRGKLWQGRIDGKSAIEAIRQMIQTIWEGEAAVLSQGQKIHVAGHRVVHGGQKYIEPVFVTAEVKAGIADLEGLAPLHNQLALEGMETVERAWGPIPQIAVFDTAFHSQIPPESALYPGPYAWGSKGVRRYGFHGISHQDAARRAATLMGRKLETLKLVTCHLGNGCSLAAIQNGRSVETTMGFTPLEGLMMGTRSGSVDPGLLLNLLKRGWYSAVELEDTLERQSGLLGISGISNDMRAIEAARASNPRAELAFRMFVHRLRWHMGAMVASLGGLDAFVFTGGIGENSGPVRAAACTNFRYLGLELDTKKNERTPEDSDIATPESRVRVIVVRAREEGAIARECWRLMAANPPAD
jgi:acetate kinase